MVVKAYARATRKKQARQGESNRSSVGRGREQQNPNSPDLLILFEDWLEEVEEEVMEFLRQQPESTAIELSKKLGLSTRGATFLMAKLQREAEK
jgi:hypothetical protein